MHSFVCAQCGKLFESREKHARFCSSACFGKSRRGITWIEFECEQCGKLFRTQDKRRRFCSKSCGAIRSNTGRLKERVKLACAFCGKEFELLPGEFAKKQRKGLKHLFCSRKCSQRGKRGDKRPQTSRKLLEAHRNGLVRKNVRFYGGYREDIGIYVRSTWEANFARILNHLGIEWQYEPETFVVLVDGRELSYTPDFYLPASDHWVEVKGRWIGSAREKYDAFAELHRTSIVGLKFYTWLCERYANKVDWEGKRYYG